MKTISSGDEADWIRVILRTIVLGCDWLVLNNCNERKWKVITAVYESTEVTLSVVTQTFKFNCNLTYDLPPVKRALSVQHHTWKGTARDAGIPTIPELNRKCT